MRPRCISPKARVGAESHGRPKTRTRRIRAPRKVRPRRADDIRKCQKSLFGYTARLARPETPTDANMQRTEDWCVGGGLNNNHRTLRWPIRVNHTTPPIVQPDVPCRIQAFHHLRKGFHVTYTYVLTHSRDVVRQLLRRREWLAACQLLEQSLYSSVVYAPRWHNTTWYRFFLQLPSLRWGGKNRRLDGTRSNQYSMTGHLVSELGGGKKHK